MGYARRCVVGRTWRKDSGVVESGRDRNRTGSDVHYPIHGPQRRYRSAGGRQRSQIDPARGEARNPRTQPERHTRVLAPAGAHSRSLGDAARLLEPDDPTKGLIFDGRIAEDFKLASGTWVSVGPLRVNLIAALAPFVQDVVVAGLDRDFLSVLLVPDLRECAAQLNLTEPPTYSGLGKHPMLHALLRDRLLLFSQAHPANSTRVRRAVLLPTALSLDHGEITDKGSVNQRAVLRHRSGLLAEIYEVDGGRGVILVD